MIQEESMVAFAGASYSFTQFRENTTVLFVDPGVTLL